MSRSPHVLKVVTHWYAFRLLARRFSMFTWIGAPNGGFALKNHQALLAAMCLGIASFSSQAATYYWDTNDSTAGFGTAGGTWAAPTTNNSTQGWSASSAGTSSLSGTTTTTTSDALNFGTGSDGLATGTVTVSGSLSAGSITFGSASGNITLGGANQTITLGSTPTITVDSSYATIVAKIAGSPGLTKNGTGTLVVPLASTYSGPTTVNGGTLRLENLTTNGGADLKSTPGSTFNINNGSTLVIHSNAGGNNRAVSNTDTFNFDSNGGGTLEWSKGNNLVQGWTYHRFVTNGGLQNVITSTNGAFLNGQGSGVLSFNVADGSDAVDLLFSTTISNALISKNGTGTMSVRNSTGGNYNHTVDQGTLDVGGSATLAGGTYSATLTTNATFSYSSSATQTISSAVVGTGGVTVNGTGSLKLTGANTYTGSTAVTAGTLQLGSGSTTGTLSTSSAISTGSGGVFSINRSNTVTQGTDFSASAITGTGGILQAGSGTTVLNASNTYSGSTTINAGTLQIDGNIANSGLVINSGGIITPGTSAAVDSFGTSSITINGGGYLWTMTSANGTAGTNWDQITSTGALTSNGQLTVYAYGTPGDWNGANSYDWDIISANSAPGFSGSNFALDLSNFGIAAGNRTGTWSFSNPSGGIIRLSYTASGDPVWTGGTGNFSTGFSPAASNGDDVAFSGAGGTATNDSLSSVNDLTFRAGAGAYTIAGTALTVNGTIYNNSTTTQTFSTAPTGDVAANTNAGDITISGVYSGSGNLTKTGSNTLTLSATNTYTGLTTVSEGTLEITNTSSLGSTASGTVVSDGATLKLNYSGQSSESITITGAGVGGLGAIYAVGADSDFSGSSSITLAGNATIGGTARVDSYGGITDGAGSYTLTYEGSSNFYHWGGGASYDKLVINSGYWGINSGTQLPGMVEVNSGGTITSWGYSGANGGTITFNSGTFNPSSGSNNTQTWDQNMVLNGSVLASLTRSDAILSGVISGSGNLTTQQNVGSTYASVIFTNASNTWDGKLTIGGGSSVEVRGSGVIGGGNFTSNIVIGGTFTYNSTADQTLSGVLSGAGTFYKYSSSASTLTLSGNNTMSGTFQMAVNGVNETAGTVKLEHNKAMGTKFITWENDGTIELATNGLTISNSVGIYNRASATDGKRRFLLDLAGTNTGTMSGNFDIRMGGTTFDVGTDDTLTLTGSVTNGAGAGSWTKEGAGTLVITGSHTASGTTTISAGTVQVGSGGTTGSLNSSLVTNNGTLVFNRSNAITVANNITGTGAVTQNGSNTLTLTGTNTYTGATTINAGTLEIGGTGSLSGGTYSGAIANEGTFTYNSTSAQTLSGVISGTGGLVKNAASTLTLSATNTLNGTVTINGGTLSLAAASNAIGSGASIVINSGATLDYSTSSQIHDDVASITINSGTWNMTGNINELANCTVTMTDATISGGDNGSSFLLVRGGYVGSGNNTISRTVDVRNTDANSGNFTINSGTTTVSGTIKSTGTVIKNGAGTLLLTGNSTNSGSITINAGTLEIGAAGRLQGGTHASNITNNGTFIHSGTSAQTLSGVISGTGNLTQNGTGTLTLTGANTYSGGTTLNAGTLVIGNSAAAGTGTITQADGTSLLKFETTGTVQSGLHVYNVGTTQTITIGGNITAYNTTWDVADGTTTSLNGTISGSGGITKDGNGTLAVNGANNTFTGDTVVNDGILEANAVGALGATGNITMHNGGSILVKANNAINDSATVTMNGGTLDFDGNITEYVGALTLSANSTIDMGGGNIALHFSDLLAGLTNTTRLNIYNYTLYSDHLYFTNNANVSDSLQYISFYSGWGTGLIGNSFISSSFSPWQVQPVPEPETWATAAILLVGGGTWLLRRKKAGNGLGLNLLR